MCENSHRGSPALASLPAAPRPAKTPPLRPALACRVALPHRSLTRPRPLLTRHHITYGDGLLAWLPASPTWNPPIVAALMG
jgi:hypothetical protein